MPTVISQMLKFHGLVREHASELAELIVKENGKNMTEALADGKNFETGKPPPTLSHFLSRYNAA
jgi:hypothetical protein